MRVRIRRAQGKSGPRHVGRAVTHGPRVALRGPDAKALLHVVGDGAVGGLEALLGQLGVGGSRRNLRNAAFVVDARGRNRGARVEVTDDALHAGIDQPLGHVGGCFRVGRVIFGHHFELHLLAAEGHALGVVVLDGEAHAVLDVLAQVRLGAGERRGRAELDDFLGVHGGCTKTEHGEGDEGVFHAVFSSDGYGTRLSSNFGAAQGRDSHLPPLN